MQGRGAARLEHRLDGPEGAPVVVLSNSLGTTYEMWDAQLPVLARGFRVLRYNGRGHGGSEVPDGPYAIEDLGRDVVHLLDSLGIREFSFCGLSLGGMVGMWVASEIPERVQRLALCCTAAKLGPPEMWDERAQTARESGVRALTGAVIERWYTPALRERDPESVRRTAEMLDNTPSEGYAGCCEAIRDMDLTDRLGRIAAPTLLVAGFDDPATPPATLEEIHAALPDSTLAVIAEAAHLANIEQPEAFNEALLTHLRPLLQGSD
ncbi:3-oxoadipate enol-lactonase [Rubrobacter radiotolerans]|uniref:3-oxoadipate enol-lactonase n=1 Tax=Rubrobacter radiotolerans TaxID=42256 RepID=A0A023X1M1_RUBRA|nr:3-oxoadipate enol-lactonase [Rubrobacter radiotolerans]AHY46238.1 3-oxoadipate enol-lactonase [Rubrobacter radiotolerans]MDX5893646.1 3-oxoadipate enol-lactonase [Rubrobacter radiotolerans]SMC04181.1 3-oxoadipate enol-lactonase [Rubrobacter radiotolerans DSM 5868]